MTSRSKAFTLIEMIITITVIVILAGLTIYGVGAAMESSRTNATKLMLQNCVSMLDEYQRQGGGAALPLPQQPLAEWVLPKSLSPDYVGNLDNADDPTCGNVLAYPGQYAPERDASRYGRVVLMTRGVMQRLMQVPANRKAIENVPSSQLLTRYQLLRPDDFGAKGSAVQYPATPAIPFGVNMLGQPFPVPPRSYPYGDPEQLNTVWWTRNATYDPPLPAPPVPPSAYFYYLCMGMHRDLGTNTAPRLGAASASYWLEVTDDSPAFLDAWNNPILFVPSCGFVVGNRWITSAGTFTLNYLDDNTGVFPPVVKPFWVQGREYYAEQPGRPADYVAFNTGLMAPFTNSPVWNVYKCVNDHTSSAADTPTAVGQENWVLVQTAPFFASAGPDGVFAPGYDIDLAEAIFEEAEADNIYSFQK